VIVEVVCYNIQSVRIASRYADRIELCSNPTAGGVSPSLAFLELSKKKSAVPIFTMIRAREGNFVYDDDEIKIMHREIGLFKEAGADGIVCGILKKDGDINTEAMKEIVDLANPLPVTFHRAFDMAADPFDALEKIIQSGCKRILTSGQKASAFEGKELIAELIKRAYGRIIIMPGAGIHNKNIMEIINKTSCDEIHLSAKKFITPENNANIEIRLGTGADDPIQITDEQVLAQIRNSLNETR
jgi:copper homeostasis protein